MEERRVVITAASAITPIGNTEQGVVQALLDGRSGVLPLREDEVSRFTSSRVFGTVDYPIDLSFPRKYRKTMGPVGLYACKVAGEAIEGAGLTQEELSSGRVGVAFGSSHGSPSVQREVLAVLLAGQDEQVRKLSAADYLRSMVHTTAANICKVHRITGRVVASCTACTTASQSIGYGYEAVKYGLQDAMLCGAADEYDTTAVAVFSNLLAASKAFNDRPELTPRPFDARRDGLVVGEGAGAVLLEEYAHARRRGAEILGEIKGFACNNNGGDMILPALEGVDPAIRAGLDNARVAPEDVDLISAHATATRMGDAVEAQAIGAVFGKRPLVTGFKGYVGHTMAACGPIELFFTLTLMKHGLVVPTLNLEEVDERCAMINHTPGVQERAVRLATVQNFAFGGVNTCLVVQRWD